MATTTDLTTITDDEARMRTFQIIGSDIPPGTAAFTGDWHQALQATAARWTPTTVSASPVEPAKTPA
ncbi:hypothetical protein ACFV0T_26240 [Streptomyces sp. NPDC059582]|uniref:hypothetical protein n=1 Tax=Streptomyces sp. NPDC059582 TaxID=3346875 RepID=UPI00369012C9